MGSVDVLDDFVGVAVVSVTTLTEEAGTETYRACGIFFGSTTRFLEGTACCTVGLTVVSLGEREVAKGNRQAYGGTTLIYEDIEVVVRSSQAELGRREIDGLMT